VGNHRETALDAAIEKMAEDEAESWFDHGRDVRPQVLAEAQKMAAIRRATHPGVAHNQ
jgi:hypothetical protein